MILERLMEQGAQMECKDAREVYGQTWEPNE
jgi:hypothetical protein